ISLRVIGVETDESGGRVEISLTGGGTQVVPFALLEENSAQTVVIPEPLPADSVLIVLEEDAAIDDIVIDEACGDSILDSGEQCDDGNVTNGDCCSSACTAEVSGLSCDDGDSCTPADVCDGSGSCVAGGTLCGDGVLDAACGEQCDDGNLADGDCCSGNCQIDVDGSPCQDDGNPCTDDLCQSGTCGHGFNDDPCDTGNQCTIGDSCSAGVCVAGPPVDCSDGNSCTDDGCDPGSGCVHSSNSSPCSDGNVCTDGDSCTAGVCVGGGPLDCDDGDPCTDDFCDPLGGCSHLPNSAPCDDSNACTTGDACSGGFCVGGPPPGCDDGNACTDDVCDPASGCAFWPNTDPCDDSNPFNDPDVCVDGVCVGQGGCQGDDANCDDLDPCSDDTCLPSGACDHVPNAAPCSDANACTSGDFCSAGVCVGGPALDCDDSNVCTDDFCDPAQGCSYVANSAPCDDGDACSAGDACAGGACFGGPALSCTDGNPCTDDGCDGQLGCVFIPNAAVCDDGEVCTDGDLCTGGVCVPGGLKDCDDDNVCTDDSCQAGQGCVHEANLSSCDDGLFCNGADSCIAGTCQHLGDPCLGNGQCNQGCDETDDTCFDSATTPCDDEDACTVGESCDGTGLCSGGSPPCGDAVVQGLCGEQCDPPDGVTCAADCTLIAECGNGVIEVGEQCDDGNEVLGDGCDNCVVDENDLACFEGKNAQPSRTAKKVVFESSADFVGSNADGNQEIFVFDRREFHRQVRRGVDRLSARRAAMVQITDTVSAVPGVEISNSTPTVNGSARFYAFVSNADLTGENPDGNKEIFHLDIKRGELTQVTNTVGVDNLNPNLRAFKAKILVFDSPANIVPDRCVGGDRDQMLCSSDLDCTGLICGDPSVCPSAPSRCGNASENREVFEWLRKPLRPSGLQLRQLTDAETGISVVGRSVNFHTSAAAFSSTADLLGINPLGSAGSRSIYRVQKKAHELAQVTVPTEPFFVSESPAQAKKRFVAFASDADLDSGKNPDRNVEIFLWDERAVPGQLYTQITDTVACNNARPGIGSRGRFIAFQSTCDLVGPGSNPGQSVFVYDRKRGGFLKDLVLRGPEGTDSSRPAVTRRVKTVTFEADPGGMQPNVLCIFNVRKEIFDGLVVP
ncbi:MAG: DUF4215 domain-containing protein, partial [Candidatus Binatia bacterium]